MGKVNYYYRRSSAEPEPYDTTEVRHPLPGNSQRAAYVYIAFFRKRGTQGRQELLKKEVHGLNFFQGVYSLGATHGNATALNMY